MVKVRSKNLWKALLFLKTISTNFLEKITFSSPGRSRINCLGFEAHFDSMPRNFNQKDVVFVCIKEKIIKYLIPKSLNPSTQTMEEIFKALVFEIDELEYRDSSVLEALLSNQDFVSDVTKKFHYGRKQKN